MINSKAFYFFFIYFHLEKIKAFLIISIEIKQVDDILKSVNIENNTILYYNNYNSNVKSRYFDKIPYEIGQKINIEVYMM